RLSAAALHPLYCRAIRRPPRPRDSRRGAGAPRYCPPLSLRCEPARSPVPADRCSSLLNYCIPVGLAATLTPGSTLLMATIHYIILTVFGLLAIIVTIHSTAE